MIENGRDEASRSLCVVQSASVGPSECVAPEYVAPLAGVAALGEGGPIQLSFDDSSEQLPSRGGGGVEESRTLEATSKASSPLSEKHTGAEARRLRRGFLFEDIDAVSDSDNEDDAKAEKDAASARRPPLGTFSKTACA